MSRFHWSVATLLVLCAVAKAQEGTHPGPLPEPLDAGAPAGGDPGHAGVSGYGRAPAYPYPPQSGYAPGGTYSGEWGNAPGAGAYDYPPPAAYRGPRDSGYGPPPAVDRSDAPRGYWLWVPAEPGQPAPYADRSQQPPYDSYDYDHPPYAPAGAWEQPSGYYAEPPPGLAERGLGRAVGSGDGAGSYPHAGDDSGRYGYGWPRGARGPFDQPAYPTEQGGTAYLPPPAYAEPPGAPPRPPAPPPGMGSASPPPAVPPVFRPRVDTGTMPSAGN